MRTPNLYLVGLWKRKILKALNRHVGMKANQTVIRSIASELGLKLRPQAADHTRESHDVLSVNSAIYDSLIEILGGAVITEDLVELAATRLAGLRDMIVIGKPVSLFHKLPFSTKCHLKILVIEPRQDICKYLVTSEILDGIPAGERVSTYMTRGALERVYRKIGLLGGREVRTISYKECVGKIMLCEIGTRDNTLYIKSVEPNQSVRDRNRRLADKDEKPNQVVTYGGLPDK